MNNALGAAQAQVAALRIAFDQAFAQAVRPPPGDFEGLLTLRVGPDLVAVRLAEVRALLPAPKIVPLPSAAPHLLGIAGLRGSVVPIYGLGTLLGQPPTNGPFQTVIMVGAEAALGLACDGFAGYTRTPRTAISRAPGGAARAHVAELAQIGDTLRAIVSIPSMLRALDERIGDGAALAPEHGLGTRGIKEE